ncbi:MAG: hypothetical protein QXG86_03920 [Candidatus Woesearchaeota archaeon]
MHKKAEGSWISYVLLVGFVVALGAFLYGWMSDFSSEKTIEIKERVYNSELCDSIATSINACNISQTLYINVTNRGDIRITHLIFRLENTTDFLFQEVNTTIKPRNTKIFNFTNIKIENSTPEVIPATTKEGFLIICTEKKAKTQVRSC